MASCTTNTVNLDNAQRVDIICRRGDTFSIEVTFTGPTGAPLDLTTYDWKMEVSENESAAVPVLDYNDFSYDGNSTGTLFVTATSNTMLTIAAGTYIYGLQSTNAGVVKTWLYGTFSVKEDVIE
jgi:hypothetical protein